MTVEDAGPARKSLTIEVPADRIKKKIEEGYAKLKTDAALPGFRRGRAPMRLIEKRFGSSIRDDVRGQLLTESYTQAIEEEKLEVIGEPDVKDVADIKLPEGDEPLVFKVEVEVAPQFDVPDLKGISVNRSEESVTDEAVTEELDRYRERFGKVEPIVDAKVEPGDYVMSDVRILAGKDAAVDGEEIAHHPVIFILVHGEDKGFKGHVAGILVDDLGKRLMGKGAGDDVTISLTGPAGHENEKIRDQDITLRIHLSSVQRVKPADIEAVAAQFGTSNETELRERLRGVLESQVSRKQQDSLRQQASEQLLEKVKMDLPEGLSARQAARLLRRRAMELAYQGVPEQEIGQRVAEMR